ncbi:MAG: phosphohistidine phosphatase SixA [Cyanobacteriota bacterium]|nr:phosphohistidine phosphatase SixA [Cyanobacteriota bacterium]
MPELYLIRHGIAAERGTYANDDERTLTDIGRKKTQKVARRLSEMGLRFDRILTSPLARSQQTAEILQRAGLSSNLEEFAPLAPGGDFRAGVEYLSQHAGSATLAFVGHQPDLGNWAEILLWERALEHLILKKAGVIGVRLPESGTPVGRSQLFLLTSPKWLLP